MSIQALREQRNAKAKAMADLTDEKRKWNAAVDKPVWDTLLADKDKKSPASLRFARWARGGDAALTNEEWMAIRATLSTTTGSQGGFTQETEVAQQVLDALKLFGGMRAVAEV